MIAFAASSVGHVHQLRMDDVGQQLEPFDDPGAGTRKVGGGVDGDHLAGAERSQLFAMHLGLAMGDLGIEAAWHHDHDLRFGRRN